MVTYYVSKIEGNDVGHKNLEVTMHNSAKKELAFSQTIGPKLEKGRTLAITITVSRADTKPDNSNVNRIDGDGNFTLIEELGPLKYRYA